jgi:ubiquinone biosynthesis monooxygenase Coq7
MKTPAPLHTLPLGPDDIRDLRSDHAGEAGAVQIYRGILAVSRNEVVRAFAREHIATEQRHLAFFEAWLTPGARSHALPVWQTAGWLLGATAALFGPANVFRTIQAVETFVDDHYRAQIEIMGQDDRLADLVAVLESFREDEVAHRDDAANRGTVARGLLSRAWVSVIGLGSELGVAMARRL